MDLHPNSIEFIWLLIRLFGKLLFTTFFYFSLTESSRRRDMARRASCPRREPRGSEAGSSASPRTTQPSLSTWPASWGTRPVWLTSSVRSTDPGPRSTRRKLSRDVPSLRPLPLSASVLLDTSRLPAVWELWRLSGLSILVRRLSVDSTKTGK